MAAENFISVLDNASPDYIRRKTAEFDDYYRLGLIERHVSGCHIWKRTKTEKGYGRISWQSSTGNNKDLLVQFHAFVEPFNIYKFQGWL